MLTEEEELTTTTTEIAHHDSLEYLLLRGWCVPWVPGDTNLDAEVAAVLDYAAAAANNALRRCVSAEEQAAGAEWLQDTLEAAAPRLLDIAVLNDDVDMFVALRPWAEKLRRAQLLDAAECRSVWLDWTVRRYGRLWLLVPSNHDTAEDTELRKAAESAFKWNEIKKAEIMEEEKKEEDETQQQQQQQQQLTMSSSPLLCGWLAVVTVLVVTAVLRRR